MGAATLGRRRGFPSLPASGSNSLVHYCRRSASADFVRNSVSCLHAAPASSVGRWHARTLPGGAFSHTHTVIEKSVPAKHVCSLRILFLGVCAHGPQRRCTAVRTRQSAGLLAICLENSYRNACSCDGTRIQIEPSKASLRTDGCSC